MALPIRLYHLSYEDLLKALADRLLDEEDLEHWAQQPKTNYSIYEVEEPYRFELQDDEDEDW